MAATALQLQNSLNASQQAINQHVAGLQQMSAANDNASSRIKGLVDGFNSLHDSTERTVANILNTINHLKLLAVAVYALSPAVRSFVNADLAKALGLVRAELPLVASAARTTVSYLSPMLSFFGSVALPIGAAVLAYKGLNAAWNEGSGFLQKYSDAQKSFFSSDITDNLAKLTKFQNDTISQAQVQFATDLAARYAAATRTIDQFMSIQFDFTNLALGLQSIWVNIVELFGLILSS